MRVRFFASAALLSLGLAMGADSVAAQSRTYTTDADFDEGVLVSVNHDAPNNDQLQLNRVTSPFPFVNIACSARGTIVRVDVDTGAILGEYLTAPNGMGRDPSRTTVDQNGNVWVSNRAESGFSGGSNKGSVTRVGLIIGGTRVDQNGNPDPNGQYLKPPFAYNTCIDRHGATVNDPPDGLIKTSRGLGNILDWLNAGGVNNDGGVSTAEDECIINYTRITGTNARTVAIDAANNVWTGGLGDLDHEKLDGVTGLPVPGTQFNLGCGGYGGLVDGSNVLWSARGGSGLLRYDATAGTGASLGFGCGDYGLGIDPQTGFVWQTFLFGGTVAVLNPDGTCQAIYPHGSSSAQGVAVDGDGHVWVAHSLFGATTVGHLLTDGTYIGNVSLVDIITGATGNGPTGVAVDANGKIWAANINSNNAMRIDPALGPIGADGVTPIGAVDMTVDLGAGAGPYNYSDMTGFVAIGSTSPQGTWTVLYDSGAPGTPFGTVSWTSDEPAGTRVKVEVRIGDDPVNLGTAVEVQNGVPFSMSGQYAELKATLSHDPGLVITPILYDLTIEALGGCRLRLADPTPGMAGTVNTFMATGATPNGKVLGFGSCFAGSTRLHVHGCGSYTLDMSNPWFLGAFYADATGMVTVPAMMPAKYAGDALYFQALDCAAGCLSNLVCYRFQ
ncbi:MAG: hypothetical protein EYC70_11000 [Planctomycetota bacterium]|nr:MAG: hypothetical protein EYC70_11000 [Planctomycetota bacterium]